MPPRARGCRRLRRRGRLLPIGAALPSEAELCAEFGASRGPVRQAITALSAEGLIHTQQGKVPVVQQRPLAQSIDDFFSFSSWVRSTGRTPGQRTLEIARRAASDAARVALGLSGADTAVELTRLRLIDDAPVMLERTTFVEWAGRPLFGIDTDAGSIFDALLERGVPLDSGSHTIDAIPADAVDAEQLDVPRGAPLLRVQRVTRSERGEPIEYSDDRYRSDRAALSIHNARSRSQARPTVGRQIPEGER
ncbi:GntR family transcriptional regulator [Rathayibacter sp. YIM 133350]|uniref:GntR family transcriptional regulator n=1 Tax=Rathayibacter sp. YIM 133350 TaxID=3131992 RepID=UPI00307E0143